MEEPHAADSAHERDIEIAPTDRVDLFVTGAVLQDDFDLRVAFFETLREAADKFHTEWCGKPGEELFSVLVALEYLGIELLLKSAVIAAESGLAAPEGARNTAHASQLFLHENIIEKAQRLVHRRNYRMSSTTRLKALENPASEMEKTSSRSPPALAMTFN